MKRLLLFALLLVPAPAHAVQAMTQHRSLTGNAAMTGTVTGFLPIAAGSFIFEQLMQGSTTMRATAAASNAGNWIVPSGCTNTDCHSSDATGGTVAVAYILSSINTPTTIVCTSVTDNWSECEVVVITFTNGPMAFDKGTVRSQTTAAANIAGVSAGTLTGTNDIIIQGGHFATTASGCPNSAANPNDFPNGNAVCGLVNSTNVTAGNYTNTSGRAALYSIAFKDAGAGTTFSTQVGAFSVGF